MYQQITRTIFALTIAATQFLSAAAYAQDLATELNQTYNDGVVVPEQTSAWRGFLGFGVVAGQQALGDKRSTVVPLISVSYKDTAYWQIARGGVWLWKHDNTRVGVALKVRRAYDPTDFEGLTGMEERDASLEGGVNAVWTAKPLVVSAAYYTDLSGKSHGDSATLNLAHPLRLSERWRITPSVSVEWLDANVVDYYYGVKPSEAIATRPAYAGKATVNLRTGVAAHYALTRTWSLFGGLNYTRLGDGIGNSPLVTHDDLFTLHLGAGWRF